MHPALASQDHRPWPIPARPWVWRQSWCDLLFAHWAIPAKALRPLVPPELEIDEFDGTSWVGVVPFRMEGVMRRPLPDLPGLSAFPELNLRLYVSDQGRPGIWFLSLDTPNRLAVWAARRWFHLPYYPARISITPDENGFHYESIRCQGAGGTRFAAHYRPGTPLPPSRPGTLEHFLTERYCLYARSVRGELFRAEVHHRQWPLQSAEAEIEINELGRPHGISMPGPPRTLHFARRLDTVIWTLRR